jgi:glycosyltransferase involved in cell wall biosynthesis
MWKAKKHTVLMLDNEPLMIDRRIILEGQTLVKQGYAVCLATRGDGVKPEQESLRGIDVRRFLGPFDQVVMARRIIRAWIEQPANEPLEARILNTLNFLPKRFQSFLYALAWPPMMVYLLRTKTPLKRMLGRYLEPLAFLLMLRPRFCLPYVRVLLAPKSDPTELEPWQSELIKFVLALRPDVVHAHDLPNLNMGRMIAAQLKVPLIYDAHELYPMQFFSDEGHLKALVDLERDLISYVDAVITVNRQCADVLESTYASLGVVPLTNASESPKDFDPALRLRLWHERFQLSNDVKIMVFQGGINPVRNVDELIHAMTKLPDNIHMGFITYAKDIPYYENMTHRLGIFHRVHYVIEIPWDEVVSWLASSDVGIMPYQVTNFNAQISSPNKLYEFVVAGLPIIGSSELVNVKRAVDEDGLGLTTLLREPGTYVEVISAMFDHPEGPERFRKNVLKARNRYMWSNEEPKLIDLYEQIMKSDWQSKSKQLVVDIN